MAIRSRTDVAGKRLRTAIRSRTGDQDERSGSSDLADLGVRGRTAGPTHPLAAWRFQRAARSGGASESQDGQVAIAVHEVRDERRSQRDGACPGRWCDSDRVGPRLSPTWMRRVAPARPRPRASPARPDGARGARCAGHEWRGRDSGVAGRDHSSRRSCRDAQRRVRSPAHRRAHRIGLDGVTRAPTATYDLRLPACQAGGRGFESRRSRHFPCPSWRAAARPCAFPAPTGHRGPLPRLPALSCKDVQRRGRCTAHSVSPTETNRAGSGEMTGGIALRARNSAPEHRGAPTQGSTWMRHPRSRVSAPQDRGDYRASEERRARDTRPSSAWENAIRRRSSAL